MKSALRQLTAKAVARKLLPAAGTRIKPFRQNAAWLASVTNGTGTRAKANRAELEPTLALEDLIEARSKELGGEEAEKVTGKVVDIRYGLVSATGLMNARIGDAVTLTDENQMVLRGYVLSMERNLCHIATFGQLKSIMSVVQLCPGEPVITVPSFTPGKAILATGEPMPIAGETTTDTKAITTKRIPVQVGEKRLNGVLEQDRIEEQLKTGILPIDALFPIGLGQRIALSGSHLGMLREAAMEIVANQAGRNQIDGCIWLSVGHDPQAVQMVRSFMSTRGCLDKVMFVAAHEKESWVSKSVAPASACTIAEDFIQGQKKNVLLIVDNLGSIGAALAQNESFRTLTQSKVKAKFAQPHKWLERVGKRSENLGGGSITCLSLLQTDASMQSDQVQDMIASQVDGIIFMSERGGCRVKAIGNGLPYARGGHQHAALAEFANKLKVQAFEAALYEENAKAAKLLGLDHYDEFELGQWVELADNLRILFEGDVRKNFCSSVGEQVVALFIASNGWLSDKVNPRNVASFISTVLEEAKASGLLDRIEQLESSETLSSSGAALERALRDVVAEAYRRL